MNNFLYKARRGFTIVELLFSMAITAILMLVMVAIVDGVNRTWHYTTSKVDQFRESRDAFESMTRRISQATLNTYLDYHYPGGNSSLPPDYYQRQSQLRFIAGPAGGDGAGVVAAGRAAYLATDAIFFQAPLGFTQDSTTYPRIGQLENLLNTWGYFIEWTSDVSPANFAGDAGAALGLKPGFVGANATTNLPGAINGSRYRYRLMEMMEPSENLSIYAYTSGTDASGNAKNASYVTNPSLPTMPMPSSVTPFGGSGREWFTNWLFPPGYSAVTQAHAIAENIIALVLLPKLTPQDEAAGNYRDSSLAPQYYYDSTAAISDPNLNPRNQLPPIVQVTMVAIDEPSAKRIQAKNGNAVVPDFGLSRLFANSANYSADISQLEANLQHTTTGAYTSQVTDLPGGINYNIYTTNVALKAAKWSRAESN